MKYRILILLSLMTGLIAYHWRGQSWWVDTYATNLSATFVGTFFIVLFIDRAVEQARERERRAVELIALKQARPPLVHLVGLFSDMIKASTIESITPTPESLRALFSADRVNSLDDLDLSGDPGTLHKTTWYEHIRNEDKRICESLSKIVDKYIAYLGVEFVEGVEALCSDTFLAVLRNLGATREPLQAQGVMQEYSLRGLGAFREEFFHKLLLVVDYVYRKTGIPFNVPDTISREDVLPKPGSSRLKESDQRPSIQISAGPLPVLPPHG
jgi:hypothetical protein